MKPFDPNVRLALLALGALVCTPPAAIAADFPTKPVRVIVPWPAGGSTDTLGRIVGQRLTSLVQQPVVIDNRPGATGTIGADIAARSNPDGYTITIVEVPHAVMAATTKLNYDLARDFAPLTLIGVSPMIVFSNVNFPAKTIQEAVALAKSREGKVLMAHTGQGSFTHLLLELYQQRTGTKYTQVGYKGAAPAMIELAGGQVQLAAVTLASAAGTLKTGRIVALGICGDKRIDALPNVPTLKEAGIDGMEIYQWWGFVAPVKTPRPVLGKLHKDIVAAIDHASVRERVVELAVDVRTNTPETFGTFIKSELTRWSGVAKVAGLAPQ